MKLHNLTHILIGVVCIWFLPNAQAISPAPDGGYPGGNTAEGQNALFSLTTGGFNTAVGFLSLRSNATGQLNTAIGAGTLFANNADENTATGAGALLSNTTGSTNTANGAFALNSNITGSLNTAIGVQALFSNTFGFFNTAIGVSALFSDTDGGDNTAIGLTALAFNVNGSRNIGLGHRAGVNVTTANDVICIGADGANLSNSCYIGQIFGATSSGGTAVFINSDGKLGTATSSRRFKDEIKPMERASEALFALKPVTFRYKKGIDLHGISQFGLVAEDVEAVNPDLVVRDKEGKVNTVRYDAVNAMLLNEFLKEHRKVAEEEATITQLKSTVAQQETNFQATVARQQKQIEALTAGLQKVSVQIEAKKSAPHVVDNNQ